MSNTTNKEKAGQTEGCGLLLSCLILFCFHIVLFSGRYFQNTRVILQPDPAIVTVYHAVAAADCFTPKHIVQKLLCRIRQRTVVHSMNTKPLADPVFSLIYQPQFLRQKPANGVKVFHESGMWLRITIDLFFQCHGSI